MARSAIPVNILLIIFISLISNLNSMEQSIPDQPPQNTRPAFNSKEIVILNVSNTSQEKFILTFPKRKFIPLVPQIDITPPSPELRLLAKENPKEKSNPKSCQDDNQADKNPLNTITKDNSRTQNITIQRPHKNISYAHILITDIEDCLQKIKNPETSQIDKDLASKSKERLIQEIKNIIIDNLGETTAGRNYLKDLIDDLNRN